jgi:hypothetical protein
MELNIARKNFSIYPAGHGQLDRSIQRAHGILCRLLETSPSLTVGVARDCLFVGDSYLDRKNLVFRDFSLALHARDIASITFVAGLPREHIQGLCSVLTRDPLEIREAGGIRQVMLAASISHIRVQPMDFSGLHLTEEEEILSARSKSKPDLNTHFWRSFLSHFLSGQLDPAGRPHYLSDGLATAPSRIAQLLNGGVLDMGRALESYGTTIAKYLRESTGDQPLESLATLIQNLGPQLRSQFLSVTLDRMAGQSETSLLNCFPDDIVLEMLQQASDDDKEISPTLINLLEKTSQIQTGPSPSNAGQPPDPLGTPSADPLNREKIEQLLRRESYETYVDLDYRSLLKSLINRGGMPGPGERSGAPSPKSSTGMSAGAQPPAGLQDDSCRVSLTHGEIDLRLREMMLALMERTADPEDYVVFSRKLLEGVPDHLAAHEIDLVHETLRTFRRHAGEKPPPIAQLAVDSLLAFNSPEIVAGAVAAIEACPEHRREQALALVAEIGIRCLPALIKSYAEQEYPSPRAAMLELLVGFGESSVQEAFKLLESAPDPVARNLLLIVQRIGAAASTGPLHQLLSRESRQVRLDALTTLLEIGDPEAPHHLRRAIRSVDPEESRGAIGLAGFYRVAHVAEDLVHSIKTHFIDRSAHRSHELIFRSLGRIASTEVIPGLEAIARSSWSLSPRRLRHLKLLLYESLGTYPVERLRGLIAIGRKSRDTRIHGICDRLESS